MNAKPTTMHDLPEKLNLVFYEHDGKPLIGLIENIKDGRFVVLSERGNRVELPANRLLNLQTKIPGAQTISSDQIAKWLKTIRTEAEAESQKINLAGIWGALETEEELSPFVLSDKYLGKNDPLSRLALLLALIRDKVFFKRHGATFSKRPPKIVEELIKQKKNEEEKIARWQKVGEYLKKALNKQQTPETAPPPAIQDDLNLLSQFALLALSDKPNQQRDGENLYKLLEETLKLNYQGNTADKALKLLIATGIFHNRFNPIFVKRRLKRNFSEELILESELLLKKWRGWLVNAQELLKDHRYLEDQTALDCFTIDSASTTDIDDAISLIKTNENQYQLGIHISLVAAIIEQSSNLEKEARRRMTSVYSSEETIHMFPEAISSDLCSLIPNQPRLSLSCFIDLDSNFQILNQRIAPALIVSKRKFSYEEADNLLEKGDELLTTLYSIAAENEAKRIMAGAVKISRPEAIVKIMNDGKLKLEVVNDQSPARLLISEMMIIYNSLLAKFAAQKKIALVFKHQATNEAEEQEREDGVFKTTDKTIENEIRQATFKPSLIGSAPARHSALGLTVYAQLSSPIRRYFDLINQRQIFSLLQQNHALKIASQPEIEQLIRSCEERLENNNSAGRESHKFWLLRYLEQEARQQQLIFTASIIRNDLKHPLVEIDQLFLITPIKLNREKPPVGTKIKVKISDINPWREQFRITEI